MKLPPILFAALAIANSTVSASPVQWTVASGGNGHYYEPFSVPTGINWDEAQVNAVALGGYLATSLSEAENNFIFNLIDDPAYWINGVGPWIGGFQPDGSAEPAGGWQWVNNEGLFAFTKWAPGEPSNGNNSPAGPENRLAFFALGGGRQPTWNDGPPPPHASINQGYVVESVPEPPSVYLLCVGFVALICARTTRSWSYDVHAMQQSDCAGVSANSMVRSTCPETFPNLLGVANET